MAKLATTGEKELERLRARLDDRRAQRMLLDAEIANLAQQIVHLERSADGTRSGTSTGIGILEGAEQALTANGDQPMKVRHLAQAMLNMGIESNSKRFAATVYATIWSSPKFVRLADGSWQRTVAADPKAIKAWQKKQSKFLATKARGRGSRSA
jgi:hypothetical protein